jgi:hypothetical protein
MREFLKPDNYWIQVKSYEAGDEDNVALDWNTKLCQTF